MEIDVAYVVDFLRPVWHVTCVFIGVVGAWVRHGAGDFGTQHLHQLLQEWNWSSRSIRLTESVFVIAFGVIVATAFVEPQSTRQALAAGLAWNRIVLMRVKGNE